MNRIKELLSQYNRFEECIIREIKWLDYGLTYEVIFDYIWDEEGKIRKNLDVDLRVSIRFNLVQEFHFNSNLDKHMVLHSENINWGINDISLIQVAENSASLEKYADLPIPFYHIEIRWEDARRIDIICAGIEILR